MLWSEVRKYASKNGYQTLKMPDGYSWAKIDDPAISGVSKSISKLARDIYNNITNNDYVQHQAVFDQNRTIIIRPDTFTR